VLWLIRLWLRKGARSPTCSQASATFLPRVLSHPAPGLATEKDVIERDLHGDRLCELVDGGLLEKALGYYESRLAIALCHFLEAFLEQHDLGLVAGANGMLQLTPGLVRIPDVLSISWERMPCRSVSREPIPALAPDFAVEVLSEGNTAWEMKHKLKEYFQAGARLVWYVDPSARIVRVFASPARSKLVGEDGTLDGGDVLPGFRLAVKDWFTRANRQGPKRR
jgi:Uma2 family endonuclease